ncbi:prenylated flavin chaperone LpdD [Paenibacillus sp. Marseille-Q7038]
MIELEKKSGRIHLQLRALFMGEDIVVLITGGDRPHLGTITAGARLEPLQTIQLQTHKEFYITEEVAVRLRKSFRGNFAVCCGAHLDQITKEEIPLLTELAVQLGDELIQELRLNPVQSRQDHIE